MVFDPVELTGIVPRHLAERKERTLGYLSNSPKDLITLHIPALLPVILPVLFLTFPRKIGLDFANGTCENSRRIANFVR